MGVELPTKKKMIFLFQKCFYIKKKKFQFFFCEQVKPISGQGKPPLFHNLCLLRLINQFENFTDYTQEIGETFCVRSKFLYFMDL